mmetsp:Transcript_2946/g.8300  ORF Transcript_2946/g.8300 Transcript_2946/m.8300 type:complete len:232 (+) Transcript_2946:385-1080(+)
MGPHGEGLGRRSGGVYPQLCRAPADRLCGDLVAGEAHVPGVRGGRRDAAHPRPECRRGPGAEHPGTPARDPIRRLEQIQRVPSRHRQRGQDAEGLRPAKPLGPAADVARPPARRAAREDAPALREPGGLCLLRHDSESLGPEHGSGDPALRPPQRVRARRRPEPLRGEPHGHGGLGPDGLRLELHAGPAPAAPPADAAGRREKGVTDRRGATGLPGSHGAAAPGGDRGAGP